MVILGRLPESKESSMTSARAWAFAAGLGAVIVEMQVIRLTPDVPAEGSGFCVEA
jgi:hypothetical protein